MKVPENVMNWTIDDFSNYCKDNCNSQYKFVWDDETEWLKCIKNYLDYIPEYNWSVYFYGVWVGLKEYIFIYNKLK